MTARTVDQNVGQRIMLLRKQRGWTQPMLGRLIGKSGASISYMEKGKVTLKVNDIVRLAAIFQVPATNFLEGVYHGR